METFKYYGSVKVLNFKLALTILIFITFTAALNVINHPFTDAIDNFAHLFIIPCAFIGSFIISKIVRGLDIKGMELNVSDEQINLPKKYYWSKKNQVQIPLSGVDYLYKSNFNMVKGIYINFRDLDGNYSSTVLEACLFESNNKMDELFDHLTNKLNFSLVEEGHQFYLKDAKVYAK